MTPLETGRLILRSLAESDIATFTSYRRDPEVARYQSWDPAFSEEAARELLDRQVLQPFGTKGSWHQISIIDKATDEMLGDCAIHFIDCGEEDNQAEIGFTLARIHQGKGVCFEAVSELLQFMFASLGIRRVTATVDVLNQKSWAVLERLRFRREAWSVENIWFKGALGSEYTYAMLNKEFAGRGQSA